MRSASQNDVINTEAYPGFFYVEYVRMKKCTHIIEDFQYDETQKSCKNKNFIQNNLETIKFHKVSLNLRIVRSQVF